MNEYDFPSSDKWLEIERTVQKSLCEVLDAAIRRIDESTESDLDEFDNIRPDTSEIQRILRKASFLEACEDYLPSGGVEADRRQPDKAVSYGNDSIADGCLKRMQRDSHIHSLKTQYRIDGRFLTKVLAIAVSLAGIMVGIHYLQAPLLPSRLLQRFSIAQEENNLDDMRCAYEGYKSLAPKNSDTERILASMERACPATGSTKQTKGSVPEPSSWCLLLGGTFIAFYARLFRFHREID